MYVDVLAPWLGSRNLGDLVIRDSLLSALNEAELRCNAIEATQHKPTSDYFHVEKSLPVIVGGSNLLPFRSRGDKQFYTTRSRIEQMADRTVLVGVGWRRYSSVWDENSAQTTKSALSGRLPHSVRDSFTQHRLEELGIEATVTGCPSLWDIPLTVGEFDNSTVVVTITDYSPSRTRDLALLGWATANFSDAWLQPLGVHDAAIAVEAYGWDPARVLPASLREFSRFLAERRPVYAGTRLHGGIRALQHGLPAVIVGVDHRATEMGRDFGLRVTQGNISDIDTLLEQSQSSMPSGLELAREAGASYMQALRAAIEHRCLEPGDELGQARPPKRLFTRSARRGATLVKRLAPRGSV